MKPFNALLFFLILFPNLSFSQVQSIKKIQFLSQKIEVSAIGLDDLIIENSSDDFIEIVLFSEDAEQHQIIVEEKYKLLSISFNSKEFQQQKEFIKPIVKRLKRANAILKIPIHKNISIHGDYNNITSKSYSGSLQISIENGIVKLNNVQETAAVKLYAGNVFATLKDFNTNLTSNLGRIVVNNIKFKKKYQNKKNELLKNFTVNSIKANIFLTTQ